MSIRDRIRMSPEGLARFLGEERTLTCATLGPRGLPHLMPLWYVMRGEEPWAWTYAKSQKVRNLERDSRATLQVEAGDSYEKLRGVMLECDVVVHRDVEPTRELGLDLYTRYTGLDDDVREMVDKQASKRVALQFVERRRATWDHRKLGGVY